MKTTRTRIAAAFALALALGLATAAQAARPGERCGRHGRDDDDRREFRHHSRGHQGHGSVFVQRNVIIRPNVPATHFGRPRPIARLIRQMIARRRAARFAASRGHWQTRRVRVLAEAAHWQTRRVPAVYQTRRGRWGRTYTVQVRPERIERVWVPARYEYRTQRVWVSY